MVKLLLDHGADVNQGGEEECESAEVFKTINETCKIDFFVTFFLAIWFILYQFLVERLIISFFRRYDHPSRSTRTSTVIVTAQQLCSWLSIMVTRESRSSSYYSNVKQIRTFVIRLATARWQWLVVPADSKWYSSFLHRVCLVMISYFDFFCLGASVGQPWCRFEQAVLASSIK